MSFGSGDLATFFTDFAVTASRGTFTAPVLFDVEDVIVNDGSGYGVQSRRQSVLLKAGTLGTVAQGDTVTVGSASYSVHGVELEPPDQSIERLILAGG